MAGQRIELPEHSKFAETPVYEVNGERVFGLMVDVIVPDPTDFVHEVSSEEAVRLDKLSTRFYGTPELDWVIARVNNLIDPMEGFTVRQRIRIPAKSRLAAKGLLNV